MECYVFSDHENLCQLLKFPKRGNYHTITKNFFFALRYPLKTLENWCLEGIEIPYRAKTG